MASWIDVNSELPSTNTVVDVCILLGKGGLTRLHGYRLSNRARAESLWLNALTHRPFPDGWQVTKWKDTEYENAIPGAPPPRIYSRRRA